MSSPCVSALLPSSRGLMVGNDNAESRLLTYQRPIPITSIFLLELYCTKSKARKQTNKNSNPAPEKFDLTHQESYRHHNQTLTCTDTVICSFTINSPNLVNRYDVKVSHLWRARSLSSLLTRITSLFELHIFHTQLKSYLVRCVFSCNCWLPYTESGGFF